ncbi:MAG TPA: hypothetical protein VMV10_09745 [Pirellulales bacterium]|nr:hypothetical protein [Pirellulales bacterium]
MYENAGTSENSQTARRPFQYGLRALFLTMACLSALFATMGIVGPMWSTILVWFLVLALAHVIANRWGSEGWNFDDASPPETPDETDRAPLQAAPSPPVDVPATQLRETTKLGWTMSIAAAGGALLGGAVGTGFLFWLGIERVGYAGIAVGGASAAVVGGLLGFLASSFISVAGSAWQEAVQGAPARKPVNIPHE